MRRFSESFPLSPSPFPPDTGPTFVGAGTGFGNSAVGAIMGPGQQNWDISLIKNTKITEGLSTEYQPLAYNVWNHAQFNPPVNNFADRRHRAGSEQLSASAHHAVRLEVPLLGVEVVSTPP